MANVIYAPQADDDLEAIVEHFARDKPSAARTWLVRIREACEMLASRPDLGEAREGFGVPGCRSFSVCHN